MRAGATHIPGGEKLKKLFFRMMCRPLFDMVQPPYATTGKPAAQGIEVAPS
jgi:hypothetical protein